MDLAELSKMSESPMVWLQLLCKLKAVLTLLLRIALVEPFYFKRRF